MWLDELWKKNWMVCKVLVWKASRMPHKQGVCEEHHRPARGHPPPRLHGRRERRVPPARRHRRRPHRGHRPRDPRPARRGPRQALVPDQLRTTTGRSPEYTERGVNWSTRLATSEAERIVLISFFSFGFSANVFKSSVRAGPRIHRVSS